MEKKLRETDIDLRGLPADTVCPPAICILLYSKSIAIELRRPQDIWPEDKKIDLSEWFLKADIDLYYYKDVSHVHWGITVTKSYEGQTATWKAWE